MQRLLDHTNRALGRLDNITLLLPDPDQFIYTRRKLSLRQTRSLRKRTRKAFRGGEAAEKMLSQVFQAIEALRYNEPSSRAALVLGLRAARGCRGLAHTELSLSLLDEPLCSVSGKDDPPYAPLPGGYTRIAYQTPRFPKGLNGCALRERLGYVDAGAVLHPTADY
ncbi:MAG TPA: hypothetical protein VMG80_05815 [Solirubrobacteraceae bacterium]|nr:hypothetical protein [Solirubrobacteraceae bacterium]